MIPVTFHNNNHLRFGIKRENMVLNVAAAMSKRQEALIQTTTEFYASGNAALPAVSQLVERWDELTTYQRPETIYVLALPHLPLERSFASA